MNQEVKKKWVEALRSGEYRQGTGRLKSSQGEFCCLGVLCDLHAKETGGEWRTDEYGSPTYAKQGEYLPAVVRTWAGLDITYLTSHKPNLVDRNDSYVPFSLIADFIDAEF